MTVELTFENSVRLLRLVGSLKLQVSFAKEPCKRDDVAALILLRIQYITSLEGLGVQPGLRTLFLQNNFLQTLDHFFTQVK